MVRRKNADLWDGQPAETWQRQLNVPALFVYETATSTNNIARDLAEDGAPSLTVVIADQQTAGRGRAGRSWVSQPGSSLLCSIVFRTEPRADAAPGAAPIRIGNATAAAIEDVTGIAAMLKWPNDVVVQGAGKIAGILCEAVTRQQGSIYMIAGIGINVAAPAPEYASLNELSETKINRAELLQALIERLRPFADSIDAPLSATELANIRVRDILFGHEIENDEGPVGRACGVSADGSLQVETAQGVTSIHTATIRLAHSRAYPGART